MNDSNDYFDTYRREEQARREENNSLKTELFDCLATTSVTRIIVGFDGEGNSGQIDSPTAFAGETRVDLPDISVPSNDANAEGGSESNLRNVIESLCYGYLELEHCGWTIDKGSCGEFVFDVPRRVIRLEFYARYSGAVYHGHEF